MDQDSVIENRQFTRFFLDAEAILKIYGKTYHARMVDLSLKDCLLNLSQATLQVSNTSLADLEILLTDERSIKTRVSMIHFEPPLAGFKILAIDIESASYLRRFVELNLGDTCLLERELEKLGTY